MKKLSVVNLSWGGKLPCKGNVYAIASKKTLLGAAALKRDDVSRFHTCLFVVSQVNGGQCGVILV